MTKADLASTVAGKTGMTKKQAEAAVNTLVDAIKGAMAEGEIVRIVGFGTFSVRKRKARSGRNPRTGKSIKIPAKKVPAFSPGKGLRGAV